MSVFRFDKEHKKRLREEIKSKKQELSHAREEMSAATDPIKRREHKKRRKRAQHEIFELERELRAAKEGVAVEPETGALPDFVVIGAQKGGTTYLYDLLTRHPLVGPAASKEVHFFDNLFDLGVEWYRSRFPRPQWKGGLRTLTGEATPYYLFHPHAAERMARVVPQARLIALLRNPVDRAYSHYQMVATRGSRETRTFEEAVKAEETRLGAERDKMLDNERYDSFEHQRFSYLSRGIYADQLMRWSKFFDREQMLILKSEDFFARPQHALQQVFGFLGLPEWEPDTSEFERKRNSRTYEKMNPETRWRLEEYFEPHNRRLYAFLGRDLGW